MKIPGMGNMMKQVQQMQADMKKAEAELAAMEVTGEAGAGLVKITLSGQYDCKKVDIDNSLLEEDKEMLEDLIAAGINDAIRKVETAKQDKMGNLTAGLNIPGGLDSFLK